MEVTAEGSFDTWPVKAWVNESGLEVVPAAEKGKLTVRVGADAPPGIRWIRLFDEQGTTKPLPFEISTTAGLVETEPNDGPDGFQIVGSLPVVIDGRLRKRGDVDGFAVTLEAGQTLVASLKGHRLGSPMDAVLQVVSARGFVLRQTDDDVGFDPQIAFEAPEAGTYLVRCFAFPAEPDSSIRFAGGDEFVYRLTLTTGPFLDHVLPLAVPADDADAVVEAFGWNLSEELRWLQVEPTSRPDVVRAWHPLMAGGAELRAMGRPVVVETAGGDNGQDVPRVLTSPITVSGQIEPAGDEDVFAFTATKDQVLEFRVVARELASMLDPVVEVRSAAGDVLAEEDDSGESRDARVTFTAPADGEYRVSVRDLVGAGGLRYFYRLDVAAPQADFGVTLAEDRVVVTPGKPATLKVTVSRRQGFDEPVEVHVVGLPERVEASRVKSEAGADAADMSGRRRRSGGDGAKSEATLTLTAKEGAAPFSGPITIAGRAEREGTVLEHRAAVTLAAPGASIEQIWLTVSAAAP